jgi:Carbohydrate-selective porin, OprB family/S-layer homology domain
MKNLQHWFYTSFLLTAIFAAPVAAETINSETNSNSTPTQTGKELDQATIVPLFTLSESTPKDSILPAEIPQQPAKAIAFDSAKIVIPQVKTETTQTPETTQNITNNTEIEIIQSTNTTKTPEKTAQNIPSQELNTPETETGTMDQVTNVTQLRDVVPSDWAYEALRSLVERYGCIAGYPDGTFRGNRAMSRYEFAAGLNACLAQIERLIASSSGGFATKEDLARIQRLRDEFATELATIAGRVGKLEDRTAFLEGRQFSTTTKLFGQAVVGVQGRTENEATIFGVKVRDPDTNINVISNVQLSLLTQFSPRSILLTGLQAGSGRTSNFDPNSLNPTFKRLGYEGDTNNSFFLSDLTYRQLIGNNFAFIVGPAGVNAVNVFRGANRVESAGFGPISAFAQRNPIINIGAGSTGVGFDWQIVPRISLQAVYSTDSAQDPGNGGIFGGRTGRTSAGVQLAFAPIDTLDVALNYINSYSPSSTFGLLGTGIGDDQITVNAPLKTNAFGGTIAWRVIPQVTVGGWFGYTDSKIPGRSGNAETINWMAFLNFPDLLGKGNLAGIYVGQPPKITSSNFPVGFNIPSLLTDGNGDPGGQPGTTTHIEAFYRFRVTDNISITPGVIVLLNPGHNSANDTTTIGALRTTFTF